MSDTTFGKIWSHLSNSLTFKNEKHQNLTIYQSDRKNPIENN